jgi:hypothetical protein
MADRTYSVHLELSGEAVKQFFDLLSRINTHITDIMSSGELTEEIWKAGCRSVTKVIEDIENEAKLC